MPKKSKTPAWKGDFQFPTEVKPMSREEADKTVKAYFEELEEEYKNVPPEELEASVQKIRDYLHGKTGWADLLNFSPELLYQMAEYGYSQFKVGRYDEAERVFKVLTVLDWNNSYYHSMMGSILQRQRRFGEAVTEYSQAIELAKGEDVISLTHRGEILMQHGLFEEARRDLEKAAELDLAGDNRWANRARLLLTQMEKQKGAS